MNPFYVRALLIPVLVGTIFVTSSFQPKSAVTTDDDRTALLRTSVDIRAAFARADVEAILSYHHPDVVKALAFNKLINGRQALRVDLIDTLGRYKLEWQENNMESLQILGNTAIEQTVFVIKGTPKNGGAPFLAKGRAQIVYVRYDQSPTGWATIREIIQPAP